MSKTSGLINDKLAILAQAPQAKNIKMCYNLGSINLEACAYEPIQGHLRALFHCRWTHFVWWSRDMVIGHPILFPNNQLKSVLIPNEKPWKTIVLHKCHAVGLQDVGASYLFIGSGTILDSPIFLFQHCNRICKHVLLKFIAVLDWYIRWNLGMHYKYILWYWIIYQLNINSSNYLGYTQLRWVCL